MSRIVAMLALCATLIAADRAIAVGSVVVSGLFRDRAVMTIDGQRRILSRGETSPEGVTLIESDQHRAVLEVEGRRDEYRLGVEVSGFVPAEVRSVRILRGADGLFSTAGDINGQPVTFIIDTGANAIALNAADAARVGIDLTDGKAVRVRTAGGDATGRELVLDEVRVGEITVRRVRAVVLDGPDPTRPLLGMSFLGQVELINQQSLLELHQR